MADGSHDRESRLLLEDLWSTPVGRRWILKAGLGSLVAGLTWRPVGASAATAVAARSKRSVSVGLQFVLGELDGVRGRGLIAGGERIALRAHTVRSRSVLRARGGLWKAMDLSVLSHYAEGARLPAHRGSLVRVEGRRGKRQVVVSEISHAPAQATIKLANASQRLTGTLEHVAGNSQRLNALGLDLSDLRSARAVAQLEQVGDSYQTATALTMTHPNVATVDPDAAATTKALLGQIDEVTTLGSYIAQMQRSGRDFATLEQATDADGSPSEIELDGKLTTFSTIRLNNDDAKFQRNVRGAVSAGISGVRDDADLGAVIDKPLDEAPRESSKTWIQPQGTVRRPEPYGDHLSALAGVQVNLKKPGCWYGTETVLRGGLSGGKVPVRLYNNFVRWVWVYVQYLGANAKNLSANPNPTFPDTMYAQSVCVVPPIFTVLGLPLWDSNTVDFTLEFPEGAQTARLLYCGLGANNGDGAWRQYFPPGAYRDNIAPTDEVWLASALTGILCIGLNVFALAADIDIAETWKKVKITLGVQQQGLDPDEVAFAVANTSRRALGALTDGAIKVTAAEGFARAVLYGGATYTDIAYRGETVDNLWNLILEIATVIPKLLFNPKALYLWKDIGAIVLENEAAARVANAIPGIGQALAIASAVGDGVTLAEVAAETAACPWMIENEVRLTYPVTVTVSRDPRSSTFPATARTWYLEALVDGSGPAPVSGVVNEGGRLRSDPLELALAAPFGGKTIQWSIFFLDEDGRQVGTGVSAQFSNNDPANPPSTVAIVIEQLPAVISERTVFRRSATTAYSAQAGGYTWSDRVTVTGTTLTGGAIDVAGAAVATLAGVAGVVWKQGDRYYLRGIPLAQNGGTIQLGLGSHEGWARRPFLLLDSFVDARDEGNHVLLEPDETSSAYHVRRVALDRQSARLSWDETSSLGMFRLPVSAAALHASGRVVAINTDTGRLAVLDPVDTPRPAQAFYAAGQGEAAGLLQSPVALAVTSQGVVLALEAGGSQVSAFDLNLNPLRYFGAHQDKFAADLVSAGTYLDLAVDGAAQMYALYFTGDGASPADYHIDVYGARGEPIATHSPGTNIPHLAVDYWRSVYGANYSPLTNLGTDQPHLDPALNVREPSFSRFDPVQAK